MLLAVALSSASMLIFYGLTAILALGEARPCDFAQIFGAGTLPLIGWVPFFLGVIAVFSVLAAAAAGVFMLRAHRSTPAIAGISLVTLCLTAVGLNVMVLLWLDQHGCLGG